MNVFRFCLAATAAVGLGGCASMSSLGKRLEKIDTDTKVARGMAAGRAAEKPVVGGSDVAEDSVEARSAVLLLVTRDSSLHACTAVFVKPRVLLTAAHCVQGVEPKKVRVVFQVRGLATADSDNDQKAEKILVHEKYDGKPENYSDLALITLGKDAPAGYKSVKLVSDDEKPSSDAVLLIGYGITDETKQDSMILRKTTKSFKNEIHLKDSFFGIDQKSPTGGFCRGDSGAPIFVTVAGERRLYGINSFTVGLEKNRECHTASVAMASAKFKPWIEKHAAQL